MKKVHTSLLGVGAGLALALATTAASADGYRPGSVKDAAPCCDTWKGFYLGIHGGYGWKDNDSTSLVFFSNGNVPNYVGGVDSRGGVFGAQAGFQLATWFCRRRAGIGF